MKNGIAIALLVLCGTAHCANDKTQANAYDNGWKAAWVTHCRAVLAGGSGKAAGFVLQIGDSITHAAQNGLWARSGAGKTSEDIAVSDWSRATVAFPGGTNDTSSKNGIYLAVTNTYIDATYTRGMTASNSIDTSEFISGNGNGGSAMPSQTDPPTARGIVANGSTYPSNLHYETVSAAFNDAQIAVLMLGTNDIRAGADPNTVATQIQTIVDKFESKNIVVVLSTIPPHYDAPINANVIEYNDLLRAFAQSRGLPLIDFYAEILARRPGTSWNGTLLQSNNVHPSTSGGGYNSDSNPYSPGGNASTHTTGDACANVGYLLRSWLTIQKLKEVRDYVVNGNDPVPTVRMASSSASIAEAAGSVSVNATLNFSPVSSATVNYSTANGSAVDTEDFTATGGTLTFTTGVSTLPIVVPITNDTLNENNETFSVSLSGGSANLGSPTITTVTITSEDPPPTVQFSAPSFNGVENGGSATIDVTLNTPSGRTVTVNYATSNGSAQSGSDYTGTGGALTFLPGETLKSFAIALIDNATNEAAETVNLTLSSPSNATIAMGGTATLTIADDDPPPTVSFSAETYTVAEGTSSVTITANLSAASGQALSVNYSASSGTATAGTDFTAASGTLNFTAGQTSRTFNVTITNDSLNEDAETVALTLDTPVNVTLGLAAATLTITDNDPLPTVTVLQSAATADEGTGVASVPLKLNPVSGRRVTVECALTPNSASAADLGATAVSVVFEPGETAKSALVPLVDDALDEDNETFRLTLSSADFATIGAQKETVVTIADNDDPPTVSFVDEDYTMHENELEASILVSLSAPSGRVVTVAYATADLDALAGKDYTAVSGTLTFQPGETDQRFTIPVIKDGDTEPTESLRLTLSSPANATLGMAESLLWIVDQDTLPVFTSRPTASPALAAVGQTVAFAAAASDVDEDPLAFTWNFADGSTATGETASHVFTAIGTYRVTVAVHDGYHPVEDFVEVTVIIPPDPSNADDDNDGFPDELETALGFSPVDPASTPFNGRPAGAPVAFTIKDLKIRLDFNRAGKDSIALSGSLPMPSILTADGQLFVVDVGGTVARFTLAKKKNAPLDGAKDSLKVRWLQPQGAAPQLSFSVKRAGSFAQALEPKGLAATPDGTRTANVQVIVLFNGTFFQSTKPLAYTAKKGKGTTKAVK